MDHLKGIEHSIVMYQIYIKKMTFPGFFNRFACICTSSGKVHVIKIRADAKQEKVDESVNDDLVQGFAAIDLPGDIFSSPLMVGGRIFVGCRDDRLHCLTVTT